MTSTSEWWLVQGRDMQWFLAHFTELDNWPASLRRLAPASSVTLVGVREVVKRMHIPEKTPTWLEN